SLVQHPSPRLSSITRAPCRKVVAAAAPKRCPGCGGRAGAIVASDANDKLNSDCLCLDHRDTTLCFRVGAAARGGADARANSARVLADAAAFGKGEFPKIARRLCRAPCSPAEAILERRELGPWSPGPLTGLLAGLPQAIGHSFLKIPDHPCFAAGDRNCQRLARSRSELDNIGAVILWSVDYDPVLAGGGHRSRSLSRPRSNRRCLSNA